MNQPGWSNSTQFYKSQIVWSISKFNELARVSPYHNQVTFYISRTPNFLFPYPYYYLEYQRQKRTLLIWPQSQGIFLLMFSSLNIPFPRMSFSCPFSPRLCSFPFLWKHSHFHKILQKVFMDIFAEVQDNLLQNLIHQEVCEERVRSRSHVVAPYRVAPLSWCY